MAGSRPPPRQGPLVLDLDEAASAGTTPVTAPPVPEPDQPAPPAAMQRLARLGAARRGSRLGRWFRALLGATVSFLVGLWAWRLVTGLLAAQPVLGWIALGLLGGLLAVTLALALREWLAFLRLERLESTRAAAANAASAQDLALARQVLAQLARLYRDRGELAPALARLEQHGREILDGDGLLALAERELLAPMDGAARREVEQAARTLAVVTAVVPLALVDVAAALLTNLRMIRRVAAIYGGRSGVYGSWRLVRQVLAHLVATGAVAAGDDLIQSVAGGGLLSRLSRRFGEGVVNAALTARVGIAAIEVCRPMPFVARPRPVTSQILGRALSGLFERERDPQGPEAG